jgi:hypothetical protein
VDSEFQAPETARFAMQTEQASESSGTPGRAVPNPLIAANSPRFRPSTIPSPPHSRAGIGFLVGVAWEFSMGTMLDHRRCAEECVAMARLSEDDKDKALWLTLAQSWVRLADHVAHAGAALAAVAPTHDEAS